MTEVKYKKLKKTVENRLIDIKIDINFLSTNVCDVNLDIRGHP